MTKDQKNYVFVQLQEAFEYLYAMDIKRFMEIRITPEEAQEETEMKAVRRMLITLCNKSASTADIPEKALRAVQQIGGSIEKSISDGKWHGPISSISLEAFSA